MLAVCALATLSFARERRWWLAGIAAAGATLSRPVGFLIVLPLVIEAWSAGKSMRQRVPKLASVTGVFAAMGAWMLYLEFSFQDAFLWVHAEETWKRIFVSPVSTVQWTIQYILSGQYAVANNALDIGLTAVVFVAILASLKKLPLSVSAYALIMLIVPSRVTASGRIFIHSYGCRGEACTSYFPSIYRAGRGVAR